MLKNIKSIKSKEKYIQNIINTDNKYLTFNINNNQQKIYYNGVIILTNKYNNFINSNYLYISNYKNGISYKRLYKKIRNNENLSNKIIILRDPPPTNKLLRNLKCKFIIILTNKIRIEYFRIIVNGFLKIDEMIVEIYDKLIRKDIINTIPKKIINCENYYNNKFKIDKCPICFDKKKLYYTNCGHCMCDNCFHKISSINNKCPFCRRSLESKNKDILIKEFVKNNINDNNLVISDTKYFNIKTIKSIHKFKNKYLDKKRNNNIIFDKKIIYNYLDSIVNNNIKSKIISFV